MSDELFDDDADERDEDLDGYEQDGPGLFDEPPVQEGPGLFDEPVEPEPAAAREVVAPPSDRTPRVVPDAASEAPLALYRRYRPDTFDDLIGQDHVTDPLRRALENNRVNHAYLFSGPRGCGKTTSARILARCLNCEQGPTPTPCGECQSCRDLARGGPGSIDVIEIDAASHGTVDDARDLRERAFFSPVSSRYKIYIIDEAHQVTQAGFNALLKLVEEPPPHVKFIFATTEPEKVIGTIRSRTHHYPFRLVPPKVLSSYLGHLCEEEGVAVEPTVLPLVVRAGAGSVRDSLSVLDQLLGGAADGGVTYAQATGLLGYTPDALLDEMMDAFAAGDGSAVFACIDKVIEVGQDPRRFAEDLLRRLRDLVVVAAVPDATASGLVDVSADQAERLKVQAQGLGLGELTRAAEVIAAGLTEMRGTTAPRLHLELMCARVLLPGADVDERGVHARLERLERRLSMVPDAPAGEREPSRQPHPEPPGQASPSAQRPVEQRPGADQARAAGLRAPSLGDRPRGDRPAGEAPADRPRPERPASVEPQEHRPESDERPDDRPPAGPSGGDRPRGDAPAGDRPRGDRPASDRPRGDAPLRPAPSQPPQPEPERPAPQPGRPGPAASTALSVTDIRAVWPSVLEKVMERKRFTWIMLSQNAQVADYRDGVLTLAMSNAGARESWGRGGNNDVLADVLVDVLGANVRVETIVDAAAGTARQVPEPAPAAPAAPEPPRNREAALAARQEIRDTREGPRDEEEPPPDDIDRDDPDSDVAMPSSEELLARELGAVRIEE